MQIAILAGGHDSLPRCLAKRIAELTRSVPPPVLPLDLNTPIALDSTSVSWGGFDLNRFNKVWLSGFRYLDPVVPEEGGANHDWGVWDARYVARQQRYSALYSLLCELDRRGTVVINPPRVYVQDWMKGDQLRRLAAGGFRVPKLLCANTCEAVTEFCRPDRDVLWRPASGRGMWQRFKDKQREHLVGPERAPVLLAEAGGGSWKRVWVLDGEPVLGLDCDAPGLRPIEEWGRRTPRQPSQLEPDNGKQRYVEMLEGFSPFDPSRYAELCSRLAQELEAGWFVVTGVEHNGELWIYDVDPDPILGWLPAEYQAWLLERLAYRLSETKDPLAGHSRQSLPARAEREALFLRRMLQILFEMEESKYIEEQPDARDLEP